MKGVILTLNPAAVVVDISHAIRPQQVEQAAFVLGSALPYLPGGAIHVAVVDPGVGTPRLPLVVETPDAVLVGPDNGILSAGLPDRVRENIERGSLPLPDGFTAHVLAEARFHRHPVSNTFHGRDIFAPAAAYLSLGTPPAEFGPPLRKIVALPPFQPAVEADGSLRARVLHIDHFGNLITSIVGEQVIGRRFVVEVCGHRIERLAQTYADRDGLMVLIGSRSRLEVAVRNGSAAAVTGAHIGEPVRVSFA